MSYLEFRLRNYIWCFFWSATVTASYISLAGSYSTLCAAGLNPFLVFLLFCFPSQSPTSSPTLYLLVFPTCAANPFCRASNSREREKTEEKRGEIRASSRRSPSFLPKNWFGFLSYLRFPFNCNLSSLFIVMPHVCSVVGGNRRSCRHVGGGNRRQERRLHLCSFCSRGKTAGEACPMCRNCFSYIFLCFKSSV